MDIVLDNFESDFWTPVLDPSTVQTPAKDYELTNPAGGGMRVYCAGTAGAAVLYQHVANIPGGTAPSALSYSFSLTPDDSPDARIFEKDTRMTDAAGWTYPGDFQLVYSGAQGWEVMIGDITGAWHPTGIFVKSLPVFVPCPIKIGYAYDLVNHDSTITSIYINNAPLQITPVAYPAKQMGWDPSQIVTQCQMGLGANGGEMSALYKGMRYRFQAP